MACFRHLGVRAFLPATSVWCVPPLYSEHDSPPPCARFLLQLQSIFLTTRVVPPRCTIPPPLCVVLANCEHTFCSPQNLPRPWRFSLCQLRKPLGYHTHHSLPRLGMSWPLPSLKKRSLLCLLRQPSGYQAHHDTSFSAGSKPHAMATSEPTLVHL